MKMLEKKTLPNIELEISDQKKKIEAKLKLSLKDDFKKPALSSRDENRSNF